MAKVHRVKTSRGRVDVDISIDMASIQERLEGVIDDDVRQFAHMELGRLSDPYVPAQQGILAKSTEATPEHLRYHMVYAHRQYVGMTEGGEGKPPRPFDYRKDVHPLATSEWDQAMMKDRDQILIREIRGYIRKKDSHD